jgi:hypothetical protein
MTSAKAIVGGILSALLAGVSALATTLVGHETLSSVTTAQWLAVIIAVLTTGGSVFGITWAVTNAPAKLPLGTVTVYGSGETSGTPAPAAPVVGE